MEELSLGQVRQWKVPHAQIVTGMAWRDDSVPILATVNNKGKLHLWDVSGNILHEIHAHSSHGWVNTVQWFKLGSQWFLATGGDIRGDVRIFRLSESLELVERIGIFEQGNWVRRIQVFANEHGGITLLTGTNSGLFAATLLSSEFGIIDSKQYSGGSEPSGQVVAIQFINLASGPHAVVAWQTGLIVLLKLPDLSSVQSWRLESVVSTLTIFSNNNTEYVIVGAKDYLQILPLNGPPVTQIETRFSGWTKGLFHFTFHGDWFLISGLEENLLCWQPLGHLESSSFPRLTQRAKLPTVPKVECVTGVSTSSGPLVALGTEEGIVQVFAQNTGSDEYLSFMEPEIFLPPDAFSRGQIVRHVLSVGDQLLDSPGGIHSLSILIDGEWGSGKTTLGRYLEHEILTQPKELPSRFIHSCVVLFNCWRESRIAPHWWTLSAALHAQVRERIPLTLRPFFWFHQVIARKGLLRDTLLALLTILFWLFGPPIFGSWGLASVISSLTVAGGALWTFGALLHRALFWSSPLVGQLHMRTNSSPTKGIEGVLRVLRRWSRLRHRPGFSMAASIMIILLLSLGGVFLALSNPLVASVLIVASLVSLALQTKWHFAGDPVPLILVLDDIDRCESAVVVDIMESVQTLFTPDGPPEEGLAPLVTFTLANGEWIGAAFAHERGSFGSLEMDLGGGFLNRLFDYTFLLPTRSAGLPCRACPQSFSDVPNGDVHVSHPSQAGTGKDGSASRSHDIAIAHPRGLEFSRPEATFPTDHDEDSVLGLMEEIRRDYSDLLPGNPRLVRRVASSYIMLREYYRLWDEVSLWAPCSPKEVMVRASIFFVEEPMLTRRLLRSRSVPRLYEGRWLGGDAWARARLESSKSVRLLFLSTEHQHLQPSDLLRCFGYTSAVHDLRT